MQLARGNVPRSDTISLLWLLSTFDKQHFELSQEFNWCKNKIAMNGIITASTLNCFWYESSWPKTCQFNLNRLVESQYNATKDLKKKIIII